MSQCRDEEYCALVPAPEDRLDLLAIGKLSRKGRYDDSGSSSSGGSSDGKGTSGGGGGGAKNRANIGIVTLFEDLQKMVRNSKRFNDNNRAFLPWRMADMMDKAVFSLKSALASHHGIVSLQNSLQADLDALRESQQETEAVDM